MPIEEAKQALENIDANEYLKTLRKAPVGMCVESKGAALNNLSDRRGPQGEPPILSLIIKWVEKVFDEFLERQEQMEKH